MTNNEIKPREPQDGTRKKKDYQHPTLTSLGQVTELTQTGSQTPVESNPHPGPDFRA